MRTRLRRYPALGFLAVAALLASLLPSALRVPLSGPSASAELAPVPGKSDIAQGDLAALGQTSTGGLGSGEGTGLGGLGRRPTGSRLGEDPGEGTPPPGSGRNPVDKRCVGNPPRQTEDHLSPPCVAFFQGDNGGVTAKGVTGDEVRIVWNDPLCNTSRGPTTTEATDPTADALGAYAAYFNARFQTYGRRVRIWRARSCAPTPAGTIQDNNERVDPFAVSGYKSGMSRAHAEEAARLGIVMLLDRASRPFAQSRSPLIMSYPPDFEGAVAETVGFVCARLAGSRARFAGDPLLQTRRRVFGVAYRDRSDPENRGASLLAEGIARRCGAAAGEVRVYPVPGSLHLTPQVVARMREDGVTTVIAAVNTPAQEQSAAEALKWYPEWLFTSWAANYTTNDLIRVVGPTTQMRSTIGLSTDRALEPPGLQQWELAMREGCGCQRPAEAAEAAVMYDDLLLLFTGIQVAGPRLTPENMDRGLRAIPPRQSPDPRQPAAYFGPGDHYFVKDAAALRWNPTGTLPGNQGPGCWALVEGGKRHRPEDWASSPGDAVMDAEGQPCQGDKIR